VSCTLLTCTLTDVFVRMHTQICEFPSKTLYASKLKSHESVANHLLRDLPETKAEHEPEEDDTLGTPVIFFDTAGCEYFERLEGDGDEGSRCNENEVTIVEGWIHKLVCPLFDPWLSQCDLPFPDRCWRDALADSRHYSVSLDACIFPIY
jgi:hypothetical protein